jgi:hypothetical protein
MSPHRTSGALRVERLGGGRTPGWVLVLFSLPSGLACEASGHGYLELQDFRGSADSLLAWHNGSLLRGSPHGLRPLALPAAIRTARPRYARWVEKAVVVMALTRPAAVGEADAGRCLYEYALGAAKGRVIRCERGAVTYAFGLQATRTYPRYRITLFKRWWLYAGNGDAPTSASIVNRDGSELSLSPPLRGVADGLVAPDGQSVAMLQASREDAVLHIYGGTRGRNATMQLRGACTWQFCDWRSGKDGDELMLRDIPTGELHVVTLSGMATRRLGVRSSGTARWLADGRLLISQWDGAGPAIWDPVRRTSRVLVMPRGECLGRPPAKEDELR